MRPETARAIEDLQRALPETDPMNQWMASYELAKARFDFLKWPAAIASVALIFILWFGIAFAIGAALAGAYTPIGVGLTLFVSFEGLVLRIAMGLLPWLPWPGWFREFGALYDTLKPFRRIVMRRRGEPEE